MGVVFSPEAIDNNQVPKPGDHQEAGRFILNQFFELDDNVTADERSYFQLESSGIASGLVYGSTALGSAGLRSDVDVLVNYHARQATKVFSQIRGVFIEAEKTYNVPVESQVLPVGALSNPLEHSIDPLFAKHLLEVQEQDNPRWSYNWPVRDLRTQLLEEGDTDHIRAIAVGYASGKARQFTRALVNFRGEPDLQVFQRALELPGAIGRKVIIATQSAETVIPDTGDKKSMITSALSRLEELAPDHFDTAVSSQQWLIDLDKNYDEILGDVLSGTTTIANYKYWLDSNYSLAIRLAQEVAYVWGQIVADNVGLPPDGAAFEASQTFGWTDVDPY